jgi:uncharacterized protein (TIGR03086 family)
MSFVSVCKMCRGRSATLQDMSASADRYRRLAARFTELVNAVPIGGWASKSPCEGWTALDVLRHVVETQLSVLDRVSRLPDPPLLVDDPVGVWPTVRDLVQGALDAPEVATKGYEGFFGPTTFEATIDQFYSFDVLVHTWDIARATGMPTFETIPDDEIAAVMASMGGLDATMRQPGILGPQLTVGDDADGQTRFLAFLGRAA